MALPPKTPNPVYANPQPTASPPVQSTPEYKTLLENLARDLLPAIDNAAKLAVADAGGPVAAVVAVPVIDAVDAWINRLLGVAPNPNAEPASTTSDDRLSSLEMHVAALTIATGHGTSAALPAIKTAIVAQNTAAQNNADTLSTNYPLDSNTNVENAEIADAQAANRRGSFNG